MSLSKDEDLNTLSNKENYTVKTVNGIQILDNDFPGLKDQKKNCSIGCLMNQLMCQILKGLICQKEVI